MLLPHIFDDYGAFCLHKIEIYTIFCKTPDLTLHKKLICFVKYISFLHQLQAYKRKYASYGFSTT